jgi:hypothetical protein
VQDPPPPGLEPPKGVLLLGVQGCGKSLLAKAVAGGFGVPLVRLDFGTLYDKYHGETEKNLRAALASTEQLAPCVLWIDEIEKGLAAGNGESDGLSRRVLGYLLTWMAERKSRVFLVATANQVHDLPAELLRKGRFDEIFFIDLPDPATRVEIFALHLDRRSLAEGRSSTCRRWPPQPMASPARRSSRSSSARCMPRMRNRPGLDTHHPDAGDPRHPPAVGADGGTGAGAARMGLAAHGAGGLKDRRRGGLQSDGHKKARLDRSLSGPAPSPTSGRGATVKDSLGGLHAALQNCTAQCSNQAARAIPRCASTACAASSPDSQPPSMKPCDSTEQCSPAKCRPPTDSPIAPPRPAQSPGRKQA